MNTRSNPIVSAIISLIPIASVFLPVIVVAQQTEVKNPPRQEIPQNFEDFPGNFMEGFYDASLKLTS